MSVIFKQVNFLDFVKILKEKWRIFIGWNSVCNLEYQNLINQDNFWQKLFCKIINTTRSFHKKKFLTPTGEMIFFDIVKKYTIFVQKFKTQKIFKILYFFQIWTITNINIISLKFFHFWKVQFTKKMLYGINLKRIVKSFGIRNVNQKFEFRFRIR